MRHQPDTNGATKYFSKMNLTVFLFPHRDNFHHATTRKHKVSSRCSIGSQFAALNSDEARSNGTVSIHG
jgi:hypothetical protein